MSNNYLELNDVKQLPSDSISCIKWFTNKPSFFALSGWDGYFRIYKVDNSKIELINEIYFKCSIVDFIIREDVNKVYLSTIDCKVFLISLNNNEFKEIVKNNEIICKLIHSTQKQMILGFELGNKVRIWDYDGQEFNTIELIDSIIHVDYEGGVICGILENNKVFISNAYHVKSLEYLNTDIQTKVSAIKLRKSGQHLYVGGYDGSISSYEITKKYNELKTIKLFTFDAHFRNLNNRNVWFPVNHLFIYETNSKHILFSSGADGTVKIWDMETGSIVNEIEHNIQALCLDYCNQTGFLVVGYGYDWNQGMHGLKDVKHSPCIRVYHIPSNSF